MELSRSPCQLIGHALAEVIRNASTYVEDDLFSDMQEIGELLEEVCPHLMDERTFGSGRVIQKFLGIDKPMPHRRKH